MATDLQTSNVMVQIEYAEEFVYREVTSIAVQFEYIDLVITNEYGPTLQMMG